MIRTRLLQTRGERRERRERRSVRRRAHGAMALTSAPTPAAHASTPMPHACDPAVLRVREAGGPIDQASYSCECGYLFRAPVSTSVVCPHCGTGQAW